LAKIHHKNPHTASTPKSSPAPHSQPHATRTSNHGSTASSPHADTATSSPANPRLSTQTLKTSLGKRSTSSPTSYDGTLSTSTRQSTGYTHCTLSQATVIRPPRPAWDISSTLQAETWKRMKHSTLQTATSSSSRNTASSTSKPSSVA
jgi:hypothetical protein